MSPIIIIIIAVALVGGAIYFLTQTHKSSPTPIPVPTPTPIPVPTPSFSGLTMLGDSIIERMKVIQTTLPEPFKGASNLGASGANTSAIKNQIALIPTNTKWVLLEGGGVDFVRKEVSVADTIANYVYMLDTIPSSMKIIVLGILPFDNPDYNTERAVILPQINALCAGRINCTIATETQKLDMTGLTTDGIHPIPSGYIPVTQSLLQYLV